MFFANLTNCDWQSTGEQLCGGERAMPGILFQSTNERSDPMLENVAHNESFSSSSFSFLLFCILCRLFFTIYWSLAMRKYFFRDKLDLSWRKKLQLLCNFQFGGNKGHLGRKTSWGHDRSEWRKSDREKLGMSGKSSGIVKNLGHHLPTKTKAKHSWRWNYSHFLFFYSWIPGPFWLENSLIHS